MTTGRINQIAIQWKYYNDLPDTKYVQQIESITIHTQYVISSYSLGTVNHTGTSWQPFFVAKSNPTLQSHTKRTNQHFRKTLIYPPGMFPCMIVFSLMLRNAYQYEFSSIRNISPWTGELLNCLCRNTIQSKPFQTKTNVVADSYTTSHIISQKHSYRATFENHRC